MKTAVDIAEDFVEIIFASLLRSTAVQDAVPQGSRTRPRRHVIDSAGFDTDGSLMFDGAFDFHYGVDGDEAGHPALRAHVQGLLAKGAEDSWAVQKLQVESLEKVDAAAGPDELDA